MENRKFSEKLDGSVSSTSYRRGSEKYDYLASRGSITQMVRNSNILLSYKYGNINILITKKKKDSFFTNIFCFEILVRGNESERVVWINYVKTRKLVNQS